MAPRLLAADPVLACALTASACGPLSDRVSTAETAPAHSAAGAPPALTHLDIRSVRAQTSLVGYSRDAFGPAWMPPRVKPHCWSATTQVRVKTKYRLPVTPLEKAVGPDAGAGQAAADQR